MYQFGPDAITGVRSRLLNGVIGWVRVPPGPPKLLASFSGRKLDCRSGNRGSIPLVSVTPVCYGSFMSYADPDKQRDHQRNWMRQRRQGLIAALGGKCVVCGTTENLEFHHVDPTLKERQISSVISRRQAKTHPELAKCELRCEEHHNSAHSANHGHTLWRRGCRCAICVSAGNDAKQKDREMKREKRALDPLYGRSKPVSSNGLASAS